MTNLNCNPDVDVLKNVPTGSRDLNSTGVRDLNYRNRHAFRAEWHDYNEGVFFITICVKNHRHDLGKIKDGVMCHSLVGKIVEKQIADLHKHFEYVEMRNHVVMPNHIHLVIYVGLSQGIIASRTESNPGCLRNHKDGSAIATTHHHSRLSVIIRSLKGGITREARKAGILFDWQSRYHDHIIRSQEAYLLIMNYIDENVRKWDEDCFFSEMV